MREKGSRRVQSGGWRGQEEVPLGGRLARLSKEVIRTLAPGHKYLQGVVQTRVDAHNWF